MRSLPSRIRLHVSRALLIVLVGAAFPAVSHAADDASAPPNVLFIAVDDLNDWISPLGGYPGIQTPNFDRLAEQSVTFTRAYCAAPACNPSRAALMCGVRPSTSGVYHNDQPWRRAMPNTVTLAQHFMAHGYQVVGGGKIYHGRFPDPPSWHDYLPRQNDPVPANRPVNGLRNTAHFDWGPVDVDDAQMGDHIVTQWALDQLANTGDEPWFLAVGIFRPHLPWYAPQSYFDQYPLDEIELPDVPDDDLDDIPAAGRQIAKPERDHKRVIESENWKAAVQGYLASIAFTDRLLGQLLDAAEKHPDARRTIIVLWGDHGWHLGEKHHWRKFALWEEATRVPLFVSVPGLTRAGDRCDRPVNLLDLYPTLADLASLPIPDHVEGRSLKPLLADPHVEWPYPSLTTHGRNNHAVRSERYRYIRYADDSEELYDHVSDPHEWTNLAADATFDDVKRELAAFFPTVNAPDAARRRNR